ncbi:MAG: InlB B-repeat-containing protein [Clostridiales bacterium]|nr:InlB B-repeat-containing protein [Clostridiales bacterium]
MKKHVTIVFCLAIALIACCAVLLIGCGLFEPELTGHEFTVTYTDNTGDHTLTVRNGFEYELEDVPAMTGHTFLGLYNAETGGKQYVKADGKSVGIYEDKADITLYPHWQVNEYTVILDYAGESGAVKQVAAAYGTEISGLPTDITVAHKVFKGWYTAPNCGGVRIADEYGVIPVVSEVNENNFDIDSVNNRIYLYIGLEVAKYSVTLNFGGAMNSEKVTVDYDTPVKDLIYNTRNDNMAVLKWSENSNLSDTFTKNIDGDITLYAKEWSPAIEFDVNGGNKCAPIVAQANTTVTLPEATRELYKFMYWQLDSEKYNALSTIKMPENSITLSAVWQAKIVFDANGGDEIDDISAAPGANVTLPKASRDGYIFAGWYKADSSAYTSSKMPSEGIKLTAKYYKAAQKTYTLIAASKTEGDTLDDVTKPNTARLTNKIDVSDLYNAGVRDVKITAHYTVSHIWIDYFHTCPSTANAYMNYYSESIASSAYLIWSYSDTINKNDTSKKVKTQSTTLTLSSSMIYVCKYMSHHSTLGSGCNARWTDFYVTIEYAESNILY